MKKNTLLRDGLGRFSVESYLFNYEEDEVWKDQKCLNVKFPSHRNNMNGPVITYPIEELGLHN
jgi:hypothetical protein